MSLLVVLRMGPINSTNHLLPLVEMSNDVNLTVVRPGKPTDPIAHHPRIEYRDTSARLRLVAVVKTAIIALVVALRQRPRMILSFNAVPYGVLAVALGALLRLPVHVGFVGSDVERHGGSVVARWVLNHATLITVPGPSFEAALRGRGYRSRIATIVHGVDTGAFRPGDAERTIDSLFVGSLLPVKRVHHLLMAHRILKDRGVDISTAIVGDGPLMGDLRREIHRLDLGDDVILAGRQEVTVPWFQNARTVVITSEHEGLPFALVEGLCCGAIPVSYRVSAVADFLEHEKTAVLVEDDDPRSLADSLGAILSDSALEETLRRNLAVEASKWSYAAVTRQWSLLLRESMHGGMAMNKTSIET